MVRLAAGTVKQLIDPRAHDEVWTRSAAVQQMWRPIGDTLLAINQQVVVDTFVEGQGVFEADINEMNECANAYGNDRAFLGIQRNVSYTLHAQSQRQLARANQPQDQSLGLKPSQQRAGQNRWQRDQFIKCWRHPGTRLKAHGRR